MSTCESLAACSPSQSITTLAKPAMTEHQGSIAGSIMFHKNQQGSMAVKHDMICCMGHLRNMWNGHHGQSWKVIALSVKRGTKDWETLLCMVCWTGYLSCQAHSYKHVCILRCFWNKCACKTSNSFGLLQSDG